MTTLCLIAQIAGTMLLRDCTATNHVYAFQQGSELQEINWNEARAVYHVRPDQKPTRIVRLIGYKLPLSHEDLNK